LQADDDTPAAVLDTNVVLDWLVFRDAGVATLAAAIEQGRLRVLACQRMRDELADVIGRPALAHWQPDSPAVLGAFDRWTRHSQAPPRCRLTCRDVDDQVFIDLATSARCRWLVTHDRALLALARAARAQGLLIVRPAAWQPSH
jgi:predicted nucleic acid-binding protein